MPHHPPPLPCLPLRRHKPPALSACAHSAPPTADRKKQRHTLAEATTSSPLCGHFDTPYRTLPKPFPRRSARERHFAHGAFTTMDTRSGNTATAASGLTERLSPFNFPQQSRLPHIAHQNLFLPHLQHNPNTVIPTQTLPLFQLKHSRHNHTYKASQTLSP